MKRYVLDTNLIIRFLTDDHPKMSRAAAALFEESATGKTELLLEETQGDAPHKSTVPVGRL